MQDVQIGLGYEALILKWEHVTKIKMYGGGNVKIALGNLEMCLGNVGFVLGRVGRVGLLFFSFFHISLHQYLFDIFWS
jgi:hypothetical protein